jgi:hypothetical protein
VLIRERSGELRPGAYLISVAPGAVSMSFDELRRFLHSALRRFEDGGAL